MYNVKFDKEKEYTSRNKRSSASSMWITCPILGLFEASGSTHRRATKRARLRALEDGFSASLGSTTSSDFRLPTILFSHSIKLTCNNSNFHSQGKPERECADNSKTNILKTFDSVGDGF